MAYSTGLNRKSIIIVITVMCLIAFATGSRIAAQQCPRCSPCDGMDGVPSGHRTGGDPTCVAKSNCACASPPVSGTYCYTEMCTICGQSGTAKVYHCYTRACSHYLNNKMVKCL